MWWVCECLCACGVCVHRHMCTCVCVCVCRGAEVLQEIAVPSTLLTLFLTIVCTCDPEESLGSFPSACQKPVATPSGQVPLPTSSFSTLWLVWSSFSVPLPVVPPPPGFWGASSYLPTPHSAGLLSGNSSAVAISCGSSVLLPTVLLTTGRCQVPQVHPIPFAAWPLHWVDGIDSL